jgi:hypothetical protein
MKSSLKLVGYHKNKFSEVTAGEEDVNKFPEMVAKIVKKGFVGLNSYEQVLKSL